MGYSIWSMGRMRYGLSPVACMVAGDKLVYAFPSGSVANVGVGLGSRGRPQAARASRESPRMPSF